MTVQLHTIGDTCTAIDGVIYTLAEAPTGQATAGYAPLMAAEPVAVEATFQQTPDYGPRTAIIRWSDGTTSEAVRWYPDELLISDGDHGNSRLMSSRVETRGVAGSVGARRAT